MAAVGAAIRNLTFGFFLQQKKAIYRMIFLAKSRMPGHLKEVLVWCMKGEGRQMLLLLFVRCSVIDCEV